MNKILIWFFLGLRLVPGLITESATSTPNPTQIFISPSRSASPSSRVNPNSQTTPPPVDVGCSGVSANNGNPFANIAAGVCVRYRCQAFEGNSFIISNQPCLCMNNNDCFFAWSGLSGAEFQLQPVCSGANLAANTDGVCVSGPTSPPLIFPGQDNYWSSGCTASLPCGNAAGNCQRTLCANAGTCTNSNCACSTDAGCVGAWTRSQPVNFCINNQCRAPAPFTCPTGQYNFGGGTTVASCTLCPQGTTSPEGSSSIAACQSPSSPAAGEALSTAAISGLGIGGLLLLSSIAAAIFFYRRAPKSNASIPKSVVSEWGSSSSPKSNSSFSAPGPVIEMGTVSPTSGAFFPPLPPPPPSTSPPPFPPPPPPPPPPPSPFSNSSQSTLAWANATASNPPSKPPPPNSVVTSNPFSSSRPTLMVGSTNLVSEELFYSTAGTAFLAAAEEIPFVGAVFAILGGLLLQVRNLSFATFEAGRLAQRLERLVSVVRQAGSDVAFAKRHAILFESLLITLKDLQGVLEKISARSSLKSFFLASTDLAQLEDSQQALSAHLIDFSAALQSEVLSAMRDLASNISSATPSSPVVTTATAALPPPFSMSFSLKDFTFSPSLQEQLAEAPRGSFGVVVFGIWKANSTPVAIKLLKAENSGGLSAWLEEAELLRKLRENAPPNIVLLYGIGFDATHGYLVVMERLEGSLRDALLGYSRSNPRRHPALPVVLNWLKDTARGMVACHAAQVVHGDIKAANVLLSETRVAKLGDMGTARVTRGLDSTATRAGGTAGAGGSRGSPLWTAPELIDDPTMSASKSCDVFSWAVLAWEMLTELLPYHDESGEMTVNLEKLSSKMDFVKGTLRPDISKVRGDAPPFLLALVQRAWSSNPLERPTGEEIVALLEGAKAV